MIHSIYPQRLRSIAGDVDTRPKSYQKRMAMWTLNISGPFCLWPQRKVKDSGEFNRLSMRTSALLGLPSTYTMAGYSGEILVQVPQSYLDRVIQCVYRKETAA